MEKTEIQDITSKKQSLKRYRKNLYRIKRLEEKLASLDRKIKSVNSPNWSGMPRGSVPVTTEDLIADKMELEKRIRRLKVKAKKIKSEVLEEIDSLEDSRYCEVLEAYFVDCLPFELIAEQMGYTERYIYILYKEALAALANS
jgi:uncharacterized protein YfcZ (UPF0381/DUF406 family)